MSHKEPCKLPDCLRYVGLRGHKHVVTRMQEGEEVVYAECPSRISAIEMRDALPKEYSPQIYEKEGKDWRPIYPA